MIYVLPRRTTRGCAICGSVDATCKPEGHMGPERGVVLSWNPEASIGEPIVIPGYDEGTIKGRFAKTPEAAPVADPAVKKPRRVRAKKNEEEANGTGSTGSGSAEQGRPRRSRRKRAVEGPNRPGNIE